MTLKSLAEEFETSGEELSGYIEQQGRVSFEELVGRARMKKARAMLKDTDASLEEIASKVGAGSARELSGLLEKTYGQTLQELRRRKS